MKKSVLCNTTAQLIAKFASMSLTVLATILITRAFGKEGYGQFSLMQALPALFYILADFGLNTTALKRIGKDNEENAQKYYQTVLGLRLLLSLVFIVILNIITLFLPYSSFLKTGVLMSSLLILTQALYSSTNLIFQYKQRYDLSSVGYVGGSVVTILLVAIFIKLGLDIRLLSFTYVLGGVVTFLVNARLLGRLGYSTSVRHPLATGRRSEIAQELIKNSLPLGLMFIFSQINFKADAVLLSFLRLPLTVGLNNIESVAIYSLPYKIFEVALVLPTFFMNATYPILVRKFKEGQNELALTFKKTLGYLFALGVITSIALYTTSPLVVRVLGGQEFTESIEVLRILSVGLFIFFLTQPISYLIVTLDKQKYLPAIYLTSAVFNVSANLFFIPKFSFYASAYITWISEGLILLMLTFFAVKSWREHYASR
jgi:O-antigen/teichoic acid export membrane protein